MGSPLSDFQYESSAATVDSDIPNEGWATSDFKTDPSIEDEMNISQYPWEVTPDFLPEPSAMVTPFANVLIITAPQSRAQEAAQEYVERVQARLPDRLRESFTNGTGMFSFPAPPDIDGQLL